MKIMMKDVIIIYRKIEYQSIKHSTGMNNIFSNMNF